MTRDTHYCSACSAFLYAPVSLVTGKCHGCRSGPPKQRIDRPTVSGVVRTMVDEWYSGLCAEYREFTRGNAD